MVNVSFNRLLCVFVFSAFCVNRPSDTKPIPSTDHSYKKVCYYTNWSQYRKPPAKFLPYHIHPFLCTHLIFAFAKIDSRQHLAPYEWNDIDYPHLYKQFTDLKRHNPKLKTLLAVGGWSLASQPFTRMVKTKESRMDFITHAIGYLREHNFDGLDLDWEYPANRGSPPEDKERFVKLVKELRVAFEQESIRTNSSRLLLSAAVGCGERIIRTAYNVKALSKYLDFINLMTYDLHGGWESTLQVNAPLYPRREDVGKVGEKATVDWVVRKWISLGAEPRKLILGIPMYGRGFTFCTQQQVTPGSANCGMSKPGRFTRERGFLSFYEIQQNLAKGWKRVWDSEQGVPYAYSRDEKQWVGYDDAESIRLKINYLQRHQLGGAMTWSLPLDDFDNIATQGTKFTLHTLIKDLLEKTNLPILKPTDQKSQQPTFKISNNSLLRGNERFPPPLLDESFGGKTTTKSQRPRGPSLSLPMLSYSARPSLSPTPSPYPSSSSSSSPSRLLFSPRKSLSTSRLNLSSLKLSTSSPVSIYSLSPSNASSSSPRTTTTTTTTIKWIVPSSSNSTSSLSSSFQTTTTLKSTVTPSPRSSTTTSSATTKSRRTNAHKTIKLLVNPTLKRTQNPVNRSTKNPQRTKPEISRRPILPTDTSPLTTTSHVGKPVLKILFPPRRKQETVPSVASKLPSYVAIGKTDTKQRANQKEKSFSVEISLIPTKTTTTTTTLPTKHGSHRGREATTTTTRSLQVDLLGQDHEGPCEETVENESQEPKQEFTCPTLFGLYPDWLDCTRFYQCVWMVPFGYKCAPGTAWNQDITACDWPEHSGCAI